MNTQFDLNEALEQIKASAKIECKDGVLAPIPVIIFFASLGGLFLSLFFFILIDILPLLCFNTLWFLEI